VLDLTFARGHTFDWLGFFVLIGHMGTSMCWRQKPISWMWGDCERVTEAEVALLVDNGTLLQIIAPADGGQCDGKGYRPRNR
jgi:hypothetical protein